MISKKTIQVVFLALTTLLAVSCGGAEDRATEGATGDPVGVEAGETDVLPETTAGDGRLNQDYLMGEWCGRESASASGTTWIFAEDGTTRRGKGEVLSAGGDVDTFVASGEVVSVEPDAFVFSQAGTEMRFERGPCSS